MPDLPNQKNSVSKQKDLFEFFTEMMGWLQIVASPLLIGLIIASIIYFPKPNPAKFIMAIVIVIIGLCIGIFWATRVWKREGTVHFMSRIMATPELNDKEEG